MALTLQDIIAKRKELGPNATNVQAREALVTNPPVPVTPTPIAPTVNVQEQMAGKTVEERQAMRSGTTTPSGATLNANGTIANAPLPTEQQINAQYGGVIQDNGINSVQPKVEQAPVKQPEPVKQVASEVTSKVESPIDYTQAKGREAEITANLDSFKAKGMTPEEIMRASDYQNASPDKKALIEPYLKIQTPTASAMYNAIASKSDIPDDQKTSLSYKIANNRYIKANMYSTMTPSQLSSEMTNSKLIQGSQAYEDLKAMNPKLVQDTENLRIVNGSKQNVFTYINNPDGTPVKVNNLEETFKNDFLDNFADEIKQMYAIQTPEEIRAIINTPDVVAAQDKATEIELTMNELEKQIDQVDSDVENEMKGSGATGSRIALEKAIRKDKLEKEYNSQLKNYTTYANKANNLITQNTTLYTTSQAQKQAQNAAMLPFITDQYKTEQEKIKAQEALNDPATQIGATMDEFAKLGIVAQGSLASKVAEANNFIANGGTLGQYINKLRSDYMAKPEYQKILSLQQGQLSDIQKMSLGQQYDMQKMGFEQNFQMQLAQAKNVVSNKWTKLDDGMYTNESGDIITADEMKSAKLMGNSYITKPIDSVGGDCGFYASRGTGMSATPGGNSKEARFKAFSETNPQVGGLAFFGGSEYDPTYGHISIVTGVNQDGTITVKESNYTQNEKGEGLVGERTVPASSVTGYYNNTPLAKSMNAGTPTKQYTESDIELLSELAQMEGSARNTALKAQGIPLKAVTDYMAKAKSGEIPPTEGQKQSALGILSNIQGISELDWNDAVGKYDYTRLIGTQDAENARVLIDNMRDVAALNNLGLLKGPMSDKDIAFLKSVSSKLDPVQSNEQFEKNIVEMYNIAARKVGQKEIKNLSEIQKERILPGTQSATVGGELDYSKYE